jgi:hypothetical protein
MRCGVIIGPFGPLDHLDTAVGCPIYFWVTPNEVTAQMIMMRLFTSCAICGPLTTMMTTFSRPFPKGVNQDMVVKSDVIVSLMGGILKNAAFD